MARLLASLLRGRWGTVTLTPLALCYLAFCLPSAESQDLKILDAEPIKVLVNENVTIPCKFGTLVRDLKIIGIIWYYKQKDVEKAIYQFDGERGVQTATRPGSTMSIEDIRKGNAALQLPHIQFNEEGDYKCVVFVTPSKAEGTFLLEVSARPTSSLSTEEVEVEIGTEKSVSCSMVGFYPPAFEISWWTSKYGVISKDTCTGYPEKNQDGTYTVTSHLRLQPSFEDNENVYTCIVKHRTLSGQLRLSTTLTVKEKDTSSSIIIGAVVGTLITCILIVVCSFYVHRRYLKIVVPKVTEITGNEELVHMEKTTLSCQIIGFRPEDITVTFSFVAREKNKPAVFYDWSSQRRNDEKDIEAKMPLEMAEYLDTIDCQENLESHGDGTYSLQCKIMIVPDIDKHNGAELCLTIKHKALEKPIQRNRRLSVVGRSPNVSEIMEPPRIIHQESITLTCPINGFKPKPLKLIWIKKKQGKEEELVEYDSGTAKVNYFSEKCSHTTSETSFSDGTFSILSALSFAPSITADNEAEFLCRILHYATKAEDEKTLTLCVKGVPKVSDIIFEPQIFGYGQPISLTCDVTGFHPNDITAEWYNNGMKLEDITNIGSGEDENGLFNLKSSLHFRPTALDYNRDISFLVSHSSLREPIKKQAEILLPALPPMVSEFSIIPSEPEVNKPLTLRVYMANYAPGVIQVRWFKSSRCFEEVSSTEPQIAKNGLCFSENQVQFIPRMNDHNCQLRCEVVHPASGKVTEKSCTLMLRGITIYCGSSLSETDGPFRPNKDQLLSPLRESKKERFSPVEEAEVLKIQCVTKNPKAGEDVILCCKVPGSHSSDTYIHWSKGMYPVNSRNIRKEDFEGGCISYVTIETNEAEDECNIRCEVINEEPRQDACYTLRLI